MRERWQALETETRAALVIAVAFVAVRVAVASLSGFGFHQGWNEAHYALIGRGFLETPLVPRYADRFVYSVPPLFPYLVAAAFLAFDQSVVAARLPSALAGGGLVVATFALGRAVYRDDRTALVGVVILAVLPYVQLYGGRTQTDMVMLCLATGALAAIVEGYRTERHARRWLCLGGGLFAAAVAAKQPALLVAGVVCAWCLADRRVDRETFVRTGTLIAASVVFLLPLIAWLALNYVVAPAAFVADWSHELLSRTTPFANLRLVLAIGLGLGMTPPVLVAAAVGAAADVSETATAVVDGSLPDRGPSVLVWWLVVFGAFVLVRTPRGHQYYALVLAPALALLAARGVVVGADRIGTPRRSSGTVAVAVVGLVVLSGVTGTLVLFELSGEFSAAEGGGTHVAADAGEFLSSTVSDDATVMVASGYETQVRWYLRDSGFPIRNVRSYPVESLSAERLRTVASTADGPVYLVYPTPSWATVPSAGVRTTELHRTDTYEYTLMSAVGAHVETDSKFTFYLNDRGLVIYRVETTDGSEPASEVRHRSVQPVT